MKKLITFVTGPVLLLTAVLAGALSPTSLQATPYASNVTNNAGTIQFYLNESNATVTVTYEDGSTNAAFNGLSTGTNLPAGPQSFSLGAHSSYAISVTKIGSGAPSLIRSLSISGNPRGVDVNKNTASAYFGRVYEVNGGHGVYVLNPDLSYASTNTAVQAGVTTWGSGGTGTGQSPYRLSVAGDDSVVVGDASELGCSIYQIDPNFVTNQLVLGPVGLIPSGTSYVPQVSHGTIESRPLITGSLAKGNLTLYDIDGELGPNYNSIQIYNIGAGPLPWTNAPTSTGFPVGLSSFDSIALGGNEYCGLTMGPNGYLYASTYRNNLSCPLLQVYDPTGQTNLWNSWEPTGTQYDPLSLNGGNGTPTADYFYSTFLGYTAGLVDSAVSADGRYVIGESIYNGVTICPLTNGIPNPANLFTANPTAVTANGRGVAWDAADNYYVSSSGLGAIQEWSLGLTATAVTKGNASGQTNFALLLPATSVSVVATTPNASQSGPTPGVFTITRTDGAGNYNSPITVNFTLAGASVNGASYTVSPATASNSIVIAAGMTSTNITINPVVDGVSRPTTTVTLSLLGGSTYTTAAPLSDTVYIQNTGPQVLLISSVNSPTIYKGLTNDPGYFVVTRYGDTNASAYSVASGLSYAGTATAAEYVPAGSMEFDPGTISVTNFITPLIDTTNYVGTKTVAISLVAGNGYTVSNNVGTISILDNQYPPATVIYSNPLTDPNDAIHWGVNSANCNMPINPIDNTINFGYDLTANNPNAGTVGLISLPPSGATNALRVTVNKNSGQGSGAAAGVNLYLTNLVLRGDYAVRFSMNLAEGYNANYTTEGALFGINHSGQDTNWWSGSGLGAGASPSVWSSDGIWYWLSVDGGASEGDYIEFTGLGGTNANTGWTELGTETAALYTSVFENPVPYSSSAAGLPANGSPENAYPNPYTNSWADVEIKTAHNIVTLSINKTVIYTYTNTTSFTNGNLMLGYEDPFSSVGAPDAAVYYSGLSVVQLSAPTIIQQPSSIVVGVGSNATFMVVPSFPTTSYNTGGQWLLNGSPIAGATNTTYSFTVTKSSFGSYSWTVNDGNFSIVSSNATLTPPLPFVITPPTTIYGVLGGSSTFKSLGGTYSGVTNYQWYTNSVALPGATSASLTLSGITAGKFGLNYTVGVNDGFNTVTSTPSATLLAASLPAIGAPAVSVSGSTFSLSFSSQVGPSYVEDYKSNLLQAAWIPLVTNTGTGGTINVTNTATNPQGFYIIKLQ